MSGRCCYARYCHAQYCPARYCHARYCHDPVTITVTNGDFWIMVSNLDTGEGFEVWGGGVVN